MEGICTCECNLSPPLFPPISPPSFLPSSGKCLEIPDADPGEKNIPSFPLNFPLLSRGEKVLLPVFMRGGGGRRPPPSVRRLRFVHAWLCETRSEEGPKFSNGNCTRRASVSHVGMGRGGGFFPAASRRGTNTLQWLTKAIFWHLKSKCRKGGGGTGAALIKAMQQ